jgi:hypothetical protein
MDSREDKRTLSNTPKILTTLDDSAIRCLNIFGRADDGEWNGFNEDATMISGGLVISFNGRLVNPDALSCDDLPDLQKE